MKTYTITDANDDRWIGKVDAENYIAAAVGAARRFFDRKLARRNSGWAGHDGMFIAFDLDNESAGIAFWVKSS